MTEMTHSRIDWVDTVAPSGWATIDGLVTPIALHIRCGAAVSSVKNLRWG